MRQSIGFYLLLSLLFFVSGCENENPNGNKKNPLITENDNIEDLMNSTNSTDMESSKIFEFYFSNNANVEAILEVHVDNKLVVTTTLNGVSEMTGSGGGKDMHVQKMPSAELNLMVIEKNSKVTISRKLDAQNGNKIVISFFPEKFVIIQKKKDPQYID